MKSISRSLSTVAALLLIVSSSLFAGSDDVYVSAKAAAMGGAYVAMPPDAISAEYNPGSVGLFNNGVSAAFSFETPFMAEDSKSIYASALLGTKYSSAALKFNHFGAGDLYKESLFAISHALQPFRYLSIGYTIKRFGIDIGSNYSTNYWNFDIGVSVPIVDEIIFGVSAANLYFPMGGSTNEFMPVVLRAGVSTTLVENFLFSFEAAQDMQNGLSFHFGQQYTILDTFHLRAGFSTAPAFGSVGFGVEKFGISADYAFTYHPELGASHIVSAQYTFIFKSISSKREEGGFISDDDDEGKIELLDINRADGEELFELFGREELASNIIKHREKVSEFYRVEELLKVQGFDRKELFDYERFLKVRERDFDDEVYFLNHADAVGLERAGISEESIVNFLYIRNKLGHYESFVQLKDKAGFSDEELSLIKGYFESDGILEDMDIPEAKESASEEGETVEPAEEG